MKKLLPLAFLFMSACYAHVETYDRNGDLLGRCESFNYFGGIFTNRCSGSANPKDQINQPMPDLKPNLKQNSQLPCHLGWFMDDMTHVKKYGCFAEGNK